MERQAFVLVRGDQLHHVVSPQRHMRRVPIALEGVLVRPTHAATVVHSENLGHAWAGFGAKERVGDVNQTAEERIGKYTKQTPMKTETSDRHVQGTQVRFITKNR